MTKDRRLYHFGLGKSRNVVAQWKGGAQIANCSHTEDGPA